MRKIDQVIVRGDPLDVARLIDRIDQDPSHEWKRQRETEERIRRSSSASRSTYCVSVSSRPGRPAASVWLRERIAGEWIVSAILPADRRPLTDEESNRILGDLVDLLVGAIADGIAVEVERRPYRVKMEEILSREALDRIKPFSAAGDGKAIEPRDRHQWSRFVTQVHVDGTVLESEELDWWLGESGWSEAQRRRLVEWYEEGLSMLKEYDEVRVG